VRVALQKLAGVEAVDVSLERAVVDVRLRAGNTITLAQLRGIIKSNGFSSRDAAVTAVGTLAQAGGNAVLEVTGTKVVMRIDADPATPAAFQQIQRDLPTAGSRSAELTGIVTVTSDQQERIAVQAFRFLTD
jgi:hypothetical protein